MTRHLGSALAIVVAGCSVGPNYHRPTLPVPGAFAGGAGADGTLDPRWWRMFGDDALSALEVRALAGNPGLAAALARVAEARAVVAQVAGGRYPTIAFAPSLARSRSPTTGGVASTGLTLPFDLSYEIDVWGRVRHTVEAAHAQALGSVDAYAVVRIGLASNVATTYFTLRALDSQVEVLHRSVESFRDQLALTSTKRDAGLVGPPDVLQAQAQLDATLAQETDAIRQRADTEHALAILVGDPPSAFAVPTRPLAGEPPLVPAGLPSALLRRRPDVAGGEHALVVTSAAIGVAQASLYPTFSLTASAGVASTSLTGMLGWSNRSWSIGGGVLAPIFDGGKLRAQVEQSRGAYDEALANYRGAVLQAFADVENGLTDVHQLLDTNAAYRRAVDVAKEYLRLSQLQYDQGLIDYLTVLDAQRTLLGDELLSAQTLGQRYISTVLLIKALGGGWTVDEDAHVLDATRAVGPN